MSAWWRNPFGDLVLTAAAINLNRRSLSACLSTAYIKMSLLPWEYSLTNSLCHMLWLWRPHICTFLTLMYGDTRNFRCTWFGTVLKLTSQMKHFFNREFWSKNSWQCNCLVCSPSEGPLRPLPGLCAATLMYFTRISSWILLAVPRWGDCTKDTGIVGGGQCARC